MEGNWLVLGVAIWRLWFYPYSYQCGYALIFIYEIEHYLILFKHLKALVREGTLSRNTKNLTNQLRKSAFQTYIHICGEDERAWNEHGNETFDHSHSGPNWTRDMKKSKKEHSDKHLFSAVFVYISSQKWTTVVKGFVAVFIPCSLVFPDWLYLKKSVIFAQSLHVASKKILRATKKILKIEFLPWKNM